MSKTTFNEKDLDFIVTALNAHWYDAHHNLERKDLGDIERKNYESQLLRSKELMESITNDSQLHPSPTPDVTPVEDGKQVGEVKTDKIKLKLEYKVIHIDGSDEYGKRQSYSKEAELLNDMGNEGWELVSVTASSINYNVYYYFKQSKT